MVSTDLFIEFSRFSSSKMVNSQLLLPVDQDIPNHEEWWDPLIIAENVWPASEATEKSKDRKEVVRYRFRLAELEIQTIDSRWGVIYHLSFL